MGNLYQHMSLFSSFRLCAVNGESSRIWGEQEEGSVGGGLLGFAVSLH